MVEIYYNDNGIIFIVGSYVNISVYVNSFIYVKSEEGMKYM